MLDGGSVDEILTRLRGPGLTVTFGMSVAQRQKCFEDDAARAAAEVESRLPKFLGVGGRLAVAFSDRNQWSR